MEFVASYKTSKVLEPTDRAFHFPSAAVAPQRTTILRPRLGAVTAMRTDQLNATFLQSFPQGIAVRCGVINQTPRLATQHSFLEQRLDQGDFVRTSARRVDSQRETLAVGKDHDLGPLPAFGLADLCAPFFAEENVPSAKDSSWFTRPWRSSTRTSRAQACCQMPATVQAWWRRQQVEDEGKHLGRSFQRAPLRRIHKMPSTQGRGDFGRRPPCGPTVGFGNRSSIRCHCSSVSSNSGSVVDSAGVSTASRDRFAMSGPPFGSTPYDQRSNAV